MKHIFTTLLVISLGWNNVAAEVDIEPMKSFDSYVYDEARVLSEQQEESLNLSIDNIRAQTTVEVLVVLVRTTDGEDISALGVRIGEEVWVGKADVDNGVVILVAVDDREWNISTGYGVEGILPDARTKRIGERNFPSYFRQANYAGWISKALDDIGWFLKQDPEVISKYNSSNNNGRNFASMIAWIVFLVFGWFLYTKNEKIKLRVSKYAGLLTLTSLFIYLLIPGVILLINFIIQSLIAYLFDKVEFENGDNDGSWSWWWNNNSWWSSKSWSSRWSFGWGSFGGWWSSGRW